MANYNILPNDVCEVIFTGTYVEQTVMTVLHYQFRGPDLVENGKEEVEALITKLSSLTDPNQIMLAMTDCMNNGVMMNYTQGQIVHASRRPYSFILTGVPGSQPGAGMPPNVAQVISKQNVLPGRGKTGSTHLSGVSVSEVSGGKLTLLQMAKLDEFAGRITLTVPTLAGITHTWAPVIWSASNPTGASDIFGVSVQDTTRVMRRRTLRVGI